MKKKIIDIIIVVSCIFILFQLISKKMLIFTTIGYSLELWIKSVVPSLFPFFIISDILISYNVTDYIPKLLKRCLNLYFM